MLLQKIGVLFQFLKLLKLSKILHDYAILFVLQEQCIPLKISLKLYFFNLKQIFIYFYGPE